MTRKLYARISSYNISTTTDISLCFREQQNSIHFDSDTIWFKKKTGDLSVFLIKSYTRFTVLITTTIIDLKIWNAVHQFLLAKSIREKIQNSSNCATLISNHRISFEINRVASFFWCTPCILPSVKSIQKVLFVRNNCIPHIKS